MGQSVGFISLLAKFFFFPFLLFLGFTIMEIPVVFLGKTRYRIKADENYEKNRKKR
jgi:hypothetical protein